MNSNSYTVSPEIQPRAEPGREVWPTHDILNFRILRISNNLIPNFSLKILAVEQQDAQFEAVLETIHNIRSQAVVIGTELEEQLVYVFIYILRNAILVLTNISYT